MIAKRTRVFHTVRKGKVKYIYFLNDDSIIASSDHDLNIPKPSKYFVKFFEEERDKGNVIEWVYVEYENLGAESSDDSVRWKQTLKVNSNNEIFIHLTTE